MVTNKGWKIECDQTLMRTWRHEVKASLSGDFTSPFPTHSDFRNSAEEFYPHETLSTPIKLLSSLSSLIWCHISIINAYEILMKPHWEALKHPSHPDTAPHSTRYCCLLPPRVPPCATCSLAPCSYPSHLRPSLLDPLSRLSRAPPTSLLALAVSHAVCSLLQWVSPALSSQGRCYWWWCSRATVGSCAGVAHAPPRGAGSHPDDQNRPASAFPSPML
jgi:hypothetical protein